MKKAAIRKRRGLGFLTPALLIGAVVVGLVASGIFEGKDEGGGTVPTTKSALTNGGEDGELRLPVEGPDVAGMVGPGVAEGGAEAGRETVVSSGSVPRCLVVDPEGRPIPGAVVSWCPISAYRPSFSDSNSDWKAALVATAYSTSNAEGWVELPVSSLAVPGALWVTASGFAATNAVTQGVGRRALSLESGRVQLTLAIAEDALVSVSGLEELEAAQVVQQVAPSGLPGGETEALYGLFVREQTVESGQVARFPAAGYAFVYGAQTSDRTSGQQVHTGGGTVNLGLGGALAIHCSFRGSAPVGARAKITVFALRDGAAFDTRATRLLTDELAPETLLVEWQEGEQLRLMLEGQGLQSQEVTLADIRGGAPVEVSFDVLAGIEFHVMVQDVEGNPVEGAALQPSWWNDSEEFCLGTAFETTDSKGQAVVGNLPGELFTLWATKDGFDDSSSGPHLTGVMEGAEVTMVMERPGELRGRVLFQGKPVKNFHIACWTGGSQMHGLVTKDFSDSADGVFLMSTAPVGEVYVLASATGYGQSRVVQVPVSIIAGGDVELELAESVLGRGIVVDEVTGEPVVGAEVFGWTLMATTPIEPKGDSVRTGADGSFELAGFGPGAASASVHADGYVDAAITAVGQVGAGANFGTIRMLPATPLTVRFVDPGVEDWSTYLVSADGVGYLFTQGLGSDGVVVLPVARRGEYRFVVTDPNGLRRWERFMVWGAGPWEKTIDFGSSSQYPIHFTGTTDRLEQGARIYVSTNGTFRSGKEWSGLVAPGASEVTVQAYGDEPHLVRVFGAGFQQLGSLMIPSDAPNGTVFEMDLAQPKTGKVQLVNGAGEALAGYEVSFRSAQNPNCHVASATSDSKGVATLECLDQWEGQLVILNQERLGMFGVPVVFPKDGSALVVVWDVVSDLSLGVYDDGVPLVGLDVWLHTPDGVISIDLMNVNSDGIAAHQGLASGNYLLQPGGTWVWPEDVEVEVTAGGFVPDAVEFRRLGALALVVSTTAGKPVAGAEFTLRHVELDADLGAWLAADLIEGDASLRTGKGGRLDLTRVPRGTIAWSLASGESGQVQVPSEGLAQVDIVLDSSK